MKWTDNENLGENRYNAVQTYTITKEETQREGLSVSENLHYVLQSVCLGNNHPWRVYSLMSAGVAMLQPLIVPQASIDHTESHYMSLFSMSFSQIQPLFAALQ